MGAAIAYRRSAAPAAHPGPPVGYQGALAGEYVPAAAHASSYKTSAAGGWIAADVGAGISHAPDHFLLYMPDTASGQVTLHGYGAGFRLWAPTGVAQAKGPFTLNINGGPAITLTQAIDNPDGSPDSWPYYTHAFAQPTLFEVMLSFTPQPGVYPVDDGFDVL